MFRTRHDPSTRPALSELRAWYRTPLGQALAAREQELLAQHLPDLFGYHLLALDPPCPQEALASSRISHIVLQSRSPCSGSEDCGLEGEAERLPFCTDTLDAILLPHVLERSLNPHQVLREVERCLVPEGHLLILGFNPHSWWGLWGLLARWRHPVPWCLQGIGPGRLRDWLSLLGFDTLRLIPLFHRPPLQSARALDRLVFLDRDGFGRFLLGGCYLLVARKRVMTMTPLRPLLRTPKRLITPGMAEPTRRGYGNCRRAG